MTNLKLQKLLYLAHMVHLGEHDEPLVHGQFEAWDYGPVHPVLYRKARVFGSDPVKDVFPNERPLAVGSSERDTVDEAYQQLGRLPAGTLVNITHKPGGAWYSNYAPGHRHITIPDRDILREFRGLHD
ncbi:MAG: Panacea domain-containing protein [Salipiger marinus]|uniref:Panacea domain-containing protein n=1 Tax=Salipiger marinus TaxID=555512 RepID=UPI0040584BBC